MGKGGKEKHQRIFVRRSIAMDPKPLNQNNAFCEGRFFFFFFSSFYSKAFRLRSQSLLSSLSTAPGGEVE